MLKPMAAFIASGAITLGASAGDSGHRKWFLQLGRVF
jgi:hypothetical protein